MMPPRRALIIKLRHHGDVLLSTPVFSALQQAVPSCEIDALIYADTKPMLEGHPAIAQIHVIDRDWKHQSLFSRLAAEWRLLSALRARHYDLVIHLSIHPRGAWLTRLLRPERAVAPHRLREGRFWTGSFTHFYPAQSHPQRHTVESNLDALRALGWEVSPPPLLLVPGEAANARVTALLPSGSFIHIHPTSRWLFKCWTVEKMAQLADALIERGWPAVLTAAPTPREMEWIAALRAAMQKTALDLSGQLSLKELAALTARARLFVGVDSAPMHMAAAMGTPTVVLFGPSGDQEWGPWQVPHRILVSRAHPCRPCGSDGCNHSKISECLTTLSVEEVLAACEALLKEIGDRPRFYESQNRGLSPISAARQALAQADARVTIFSHEGSLRVAKTARPADLAYEVRRITHLADAGERVPAILAFEKDCLLLDYAGNTLEQQLYDIPIADRITLLDAALDDLARFHRAGHWHGGAQIKNILLQDGAFIRIDFETRLGDWLSQPVMQAYDLLLFINSSTLLSGMKDHDVGTNLAKHLLAHYLEIAPHADAVRAVLRRVRPALRVLCALTRPWRYRRGRSLRRIFVLRDMLQPWPTLQSTA